MTIRLDHVLEPGSGKAVEVRRGEVVRVEQLEGGQCADFNAFNLHDYREFFHCGRTRVLHGMFPTTGDMLWSAPPRERPMFTIIADTAGINDISFPRCTGVLFEYAWGFQTHTNCQDILAEAEREYGLTPDDVHDSFNLWMNTKIDADTGRLSVERNTSQAGDYVELVAHFDCLVVLSVCGADVFNTSNFSLKPLRLAVRGATAGERDEWLLPEARRFANQRVVDDFKIKEIRTERELSRDPTYVADWPGFPISTTSVEVELTDGEYRQLEALRSHGGFGATDGEVLRHAFFTWCIDHWMQPDPTPAGQKLSDHGPVAAVEEPH
jgi:uncharacterized protein YcgI (DUF1989 family)